MNIKSVFEYPIDKRGEIIKNRKPDDIILVDLPFSLKSGKITYLNKIIDVIFDEKRKLFKSYSKNIIDEFEKKFIENKWPYNIYNQIVIKILEEIEMRGRGREPTSILMLDLLKVIIENGDYKKLLEDPSSYPGNHIYYYYSKHNSDLFKRIYNNDKKNEIIKAILQIHSPHEKYLYLLEAFRGVDLLFNKYMLDIYPTYCFNLLNKRCNNVLIQCGVKKTLISIIERKIGEMENLDCFIGLGALDNIAQRLPKQLQLDKVSDISNKTKNKYWDVIFNSYKKMIKQYPELKLEKSFIKTMMDRKSLENEILQNERFKSHNNSQPFQNKKKRKI